MILIDFGWQVILFFQFLFQVSWTEATQTLCSRFVQYTATLSIRPPLHGYSKVETIQLFIHSFWCGTFVCVENTDTGVPENILWSSKTTTLQQITALGIVDFVDLYIWWKSSSQNHFKANFVGCFCFGLFSRGICSKWQQQKNKTVLEQGVGIEKK